MSLFGGGSKRSRRTFQTVSPEIAVATEQAESPVQAPVITAGGKRSSTTVGGTAPTSGPVSVVRASNVNVTETFNTVRDVGITGPQLIALEQSRKAPQIFVGSPSVSVAPPEVSVGQPSVFVQQPQGGGFELQVKKTVSDRFQLAGATPSGDDFVPLVGGSNALKAEPVEQEPSTGPRIQLGGLALLALAGFLLLR